MVTALLPQRTFLILLPQFGLHPETYKTDWTSSGEDRKYENTGVHVHKFGAILKCTWQQMCTLNISQRNLKRSVHALQEIILSNQIKLCTLILRERYKLSLKSCSFYGYGYHKRNSIHLQCIKVERQITETFKTTSAWREKMYIWTDPLGLT